MVASEDFVCGSSIIHRLDPRVKVVAALFFATVVALCDSGASVGLALLTGTLLALGARLPGRKLLRRLLLANGLIFFLWALLPFTTAGEAMFRIGPLGASRSGIRLAAILTLKANAIILSMLALLATSSIIAIGHALDHLRVPPKLVHLFFFTFRYLQVMDSEYHRLRLAMKARAFVPRSDLHTYRSLAYLVGMLLVRSIQRAEAVRKAMVCRGFHGKFYLLHHFALEGKDAAVAAVLAVAVLAIAILEVGQWLPLR